MLNLNDSEQSLSEKDLCEIRSLFISNIPEDFLEFYKKDNGGYPEENMVMSKENIYSLNGFHPIKYGRLSIERLFVDLTNENPEFKDYIPFAYDDGGNNYLLSLAPETYGNILLWIWEENNLALVSRSFRDFISSLYTDI
jgi:hypothetical protein